jgi:hypothetical protein
VEILKGTSKKRVREYAYEIDKEKPKDFDVCLNKVIQYIRDRNSEKATKRRKHNKEEPPQST